MIAAGAALASCWGVPLAAAPPTSGTISIETEAGDDALSPSLPAFANALGEAFETRGFTVLEQPGHAAYVVEMRLTRADVGTGTARVPRESSSVIPGGAPNAVGVGVSIPLATGKSTLVPLQRTQLEVRIHRRDDPSILWHGAAITVRAAGTRKGQDATVAADLSQALLRAYPAQPEDIVGVP
jgi:hypothetical protein